MTAPDSLIDGNSPRRSAVVMQAIRYAMAGGIITVLVTAGYWLIATFLHIDPNAALAIVFVFFSGVSYIVHGIYSFRGVGDGGRHHVRATRFLLVNILGFFTNQLFVWFFVKHLHGPTWWPIPAIVGITPLATFALHRRWVYS